jgi:hypothetical protein
MPVSLSNKLSIKDVDLKGKRVVMRSVPPLVSFVRGAKGLTSTIRFRNLRTM